MDAKPRMPPLRTGFSWRSAAPGDRMAGDFLINAQRAHDAQLIQKVEAYLQEQILTALIFVF